MGIPFSLPLLDDDVVAEVIDALTNTGWITSGPKVQQFEQAIAAYTGTAATVANSSWTAGAMVMLRWFGVQPGDEVIVPAYTYCATALAAMNVGATPVMVDIQSPFHLDLDQLAAAISPRTKAIIPVDLGGWPCDYQAIREIVAQAAARNGFAPGSERQRKLCRPLIIADAAHSLGATCDGRMVGTLTDVTVFSFHSVKNLTTGEGGMICLNLPAPFENADEQRVVRYLSLNGQTKSALEKSQVGGWRYDIVEQGFKANMPDLCAAIGLAQLRKYASDLLPERRQIFDAYNSVLAPYDWAQLPPMQDQRRVSSYHLYQLRIRGASEQQRNSVMQRLSEAGMGVNVHYVPMPGLTLFREKGYRSEDFPVSFAHYQNEITLPVYNRLGLENVDKIAREVVRAVELECR